MQQIDRARRVQTAHWPSRPPEKRTGAGRRAGRKRRQQIGDDRVVVARVERDVVAAALGHAAVDVQRAIAIERRDLDRDDALDVEEAAPESAIEDAPADRRLQVEAEDRNDVGDAAAVLEERRVVGVAQRAKAEQRGVVAERRRELRFASACARRPTTPAISQRAAGRTRTSPAPCAAASSSTGSSRPTAARESRTASCARRPRCRRRRRRSSSASARPGGARRAGASAVSASGWAGMTSPRRSARRSSTSRSRVRSGHR